MRTLITGLAVYAAGVWLWLTVATRYWQARPMFDLGTDVVLLLLVSLYGIGTLIWPIPAIADWWQWRRSH